MDSMVLCKNISKKMGEFSLQDICFTLPKGYVLGVIGRNGCGKTTLLRCLTGMYRLAGEVSIDHISINEDEKAFKKSLFFVSQECPYLEGRRIKEVGQLYGCYYDGFTMDRYQKNLERLQVPAKCCVANLSKGQKIRMQLAFALSVDVKVYFFDEPAGNLDVEFREDFYRIIRELLADGEKTIIYASHLVEELEQIADYLLWLHKENGQGKVKFYGTLEECKEKYRMMEGTKESLEAISSVQIVGGRKRENHEEWLVLSEGLPQQQKALARYADLKEIMYYGEKGTVQ